ncbi:hypothetical protein V6N13_122037 [Hibiscus sabdariffa]
MRNCKATLSKRAMASVDTAVVDVWQREVGELSNRKFANSIAASQIDLRTAAATKLFKCPSIDDRRLDFTPLYHMAVDPMNPDIFAVAGSDKHTLLYDIRKSKRDGSTDFGQPIDLFYPPHLIGDNRVGVIDLAFSDQNELLVAYNDTSVYLFTRDMGLGLDPVPPSPSFARSEASEKVIPQVYKGHANYERVKRVSFFGPKSEYVVIESDFGRIFFWKKKRGELVHVIKADKRRVNFIESHPHTAALASCGSEDIKIWTPKAIDKAVTPTQIELDQQVQRRGRWRFEYFKKFIDDIECISCGLELTSSDEE